MGFFKSEFILTTGEDVNKSSTFMKECLSRAIQWMSPGLLACEAPDDITVKLQDLLHLHSKNLFDTFGELSVLQKLELLLVDIKNKDFDTMKLCLQKLEPYNQHVVCNTWKLYSQFLHTDFDAFLCIHCKIRCRVNIKLCGRYLYRQGIISDQLYKTMICRMSSAGNQEDLWNDMEEEYSKYHTPKHVLECIYSAIESQGVEYEYLKAELQQMLQNENPSFTCRCQESCSKMFMPNTTTDMVLNVLSGNDKENQIPKQITKPKRRSVTRSSKTKRQKTKQELLPKETRVTEETEHLETDSQSSQDEPKRQIKRSTNVSNYYFCNKGLVKFSSRLVKLSAPMKSEKQNETEDYVSDELESDPRPDILVKNTKTTSRKTRVPISITETQGETFAKRLKSNSLSLNLNNPKDLECQDSSTTPSTSDDPGFTRHGTVSAKIQPDTGYHKNSIAGNVSKGIEQDGREKSNTNEFVDEETEAI